MRLIHWLWPGHTGGLQPRHYGIGGIGAVLLLLAKIVLILVAVQGAVTVVRHTGHWYLEHNRPAKTVPAPTPPAPLPLLTPTPTAPATQPSAGGGSRYTVWFRYLPAIRNQGNTNSCTSWATVYYSLSYLSRQHKHDGINYSPCFAYDVAVNGSNATTAPDQELRVIRAYGIPKYSTFPQGCNWPYSWIPRSAWDNAAHHRLWVTTHSFSYGYNNPNTLIGIRRRLAAHKPAVIDIPLHYNFYNANAYGGWIDYPSSSYNYGGHAVTVVYDNPTLWHNGVRGWMLIANSFGTGWGVNKYGVYRGSRGFAWVSERFVAAYTYFGYWPVIHWPHRHAGHGAGTGPRTATAASVGHLTASQGHRPMPKAGAASPSFHHNYHHRPRHGWYVRGVYTIDSHRDISRITNAAGDYWHVKPVFLAAVMRSESSLEQYAERWNGWYDTSFSLMQISLATACAYKDICNADALRAWEDDPVHSIFLGARILHDDHVRTGWVAPMLWNVYNVGHAATSPYYDNGFLPNWDYAYTHYRT